MVYYELLGKSISGPFTIPSGIVTTEPSVIRRIADDIPEIGIITTKSISVEPREGNREPIITQYAPLCFANAVGLRNPGAEKFAEGLAEISPLPDDKFLMVSIFGGNKDEFLGAAEYLYEYADGFELNVSCPHAEGYGQAIGQDTELVIDIAKGVKKFGKPVFIKLSPNINFDPILAEHADGFVAINTAGPGMHIVDGYPVLTNIKGGISGRSILPIGVGYISDLRKALNERGYNKPIIACGGISTADHVRNYKSVGADFFGVGSALAGMNTEEIEKYFSYLMRDYQKGTNRAMKRVKADVGMSYISCHVAQRGDLADDLFILEFEEDIQVKPGQFIFAWLPEKGEKPFSVLDDEPLTLLIGKRGYFTETLSKLEPGDNLYIRGPYGRPLNVHGNVLRRGLFGRQLKVPGDILMVGGGTGIAALYLPMKNKHEGTTTALLGAKSKKHLPLWYFDHKDVNLEVATEDGSYGHKGLVTDLLEKALESGKFDYCVNCGSEAMTNAVLEIELRYLKPEEIFSSIDYPTHCGVGLCGSCATKSGYRSCVDGPFMNK
ncbi:MAG: dihydroorotate dehydrogenase [Nanoarchaeota archaeon]|nr:dihydroorotate dehydrogenase [Nanoarchaeota archaeon]